MTHPEFVEWQRRASWMSLPWTKPPVAVSAREGRHHLWESGDRRESHLVAAWPRGLYAAGLAERLHDMIGDMFGSARSSWRTQRSTFREVSDRFFGPEDGDDVLDVVFATPSRLASRYWPKLGRDPVRLNVESPVPVTSTLDRGRRLRLPYLKTAVELPVERFGWIRRAGQRAATTRLLMTRMRKSLGAHAATTWRVFEADESMSADRADVLLGNVPGLADAEIPTGDVHRIHAPMVQLLRIDIRQNVDLVMLEAHRESGELIDIRWNRTSLAGIVLPDPWYATALWDALEHGKRLRR